MAEINLGGWHTYHQERIHSRTEKYRLVQMIHMIVCGFLDKVEHSRQSRKQQKQGAGKACHVLVAQCTQLKTFELVDLRAGRRGAGTADEDSDTRGKGSGWTSRGQVEDGHKIPCPIRSLPAMERFGPGPATTESGPCGVGWRACAALNGASVPAGHACMDWAWHHQRIRIIGTARAGEVPDWRIVTAHIAELSLWPMPAAVGGCRTHLLKRTNTCSVPPRCIPPRCISMKVDQDCCYPPRACRRAGLLPDTPAHTFTHSPDHI
jgi:hypothetical protein